MFDWDDLKYFLAVAHHGSTLSGSRALRVDQSTVQRRLVVRNSSVLGLVNSAKAAMGLAPLPTAVGDSERQALRPIITG